MKDYIMSSWTALASLAIALGALIWRLSARLSKTETTTDTHESELQHARQNITTLFARHDEVKQDVSAVRETVARIEEKQQAAIVLSAERRNNQEKQYESILHEIRCIKKEVQTRGK